MELSSYRKLLLMTGFVAIIVIGGTGLLASGDGRSQPPAGVVVDYNKTAETARVVYLGSGGYDASHVLFADEIRVSHNGGELVPWNGKTERGVVKSASVHTVTDVHPGDTIGVRISMDEYAKNTTFEFVVGEYDFLTTGVDGKLK